MKCQNKFIYEIFKLVKFQKNVIFFYGTLMQTWYSNNKKNWFVLSAINQFTHARMKRFHKKNTEKKIYIFLCKMISIIKNHIDIKQNIFWRGNFADSNIILIKLFW